MRRRAISSVIIDGYNVIGIVHTDAEKARDEFVDLMIGYRKLKPHDITVVFDGYKGGAGSEHMSVRGGVKVIYSRLGERADDVIKRIISSDRREWIVITSDRDIAHHAWSVDSIPVPSDRFIEIVTRQVHRKGPSDADSSAGEESGYGMPDKDCDDGSECGRPKGNPHQLSKKERAVRKALSKL